MAATRHRPPGKNLMLPMNRSCITLSIECRTLKAEGQGFKVGRAAVLEMVFAPRSRRALGVSAIKGKARACLAVSSVALAKDEDLVRADTGLFVPSKGGQAFATLV